MALTKKQKHFLDFICEYLDRHGFAPTQKEIKDHFGFKSLGSVQDYIKYLTNAGYLKSNPNAVRGLEPLLPKEENNQVPMLGKIAAGRPIEAIEHQEYLELPYQDRDSSQLFALKVSGDSMINAGIFDGDTVIIQAQNHASNGDIVVASVNNEVTLKRLQKKGKQALLIAENEAFSTIKISLDQLEIKGILKALMRSY